MTALGIVLITAATVLIDWLVSPEMRRHFRARRRLRARSQRPSPAVESERLLQLRHWQAMAADARARMLRYADHHYDRNRATVDHEHAQRQIEALSRPR
jgi:hypothetical protein